MFSSGQERHFGQWRELLDVLVGLVRGLPVQPLFVAPLFCPQENKDNGFTQDNKTFISSIKIALQNKYSKGSPHKASRYLVTAEQQFRAEK